MEPQDSKAVHHSLGQQRLTWSVLSVLRLLHLLWRQAVNLLWSPLLLTYMAGYQKPLTYAQKRPIHLMLPKQRPWLGGKSTTSKCDIKRSTYWIIQWLRENVLSILYLSKHQSLRISQTWRSSILLALPKFMLHMYDILLQIVLKGTYDLHSIISPNKEHAKLQGRHVISAIFIDSYEKLCYDIEHTVSFKFLFSNQSMRFL